MTSQAKLRAGGGTAGRNHRLTSCSPVVRALVYQPRGPGFNSWHVSFRVSFNKGENPNDAAAATYQVFVNYMLMCLLLAINPQSVYCCECILNLYECIS